MPRKQTRAIAEPTEIQTQSEEMNDTQAVGIDEGEKFPQTDSENTESQRIHDEDGANADGSEAISQTDSESSDSSPQNAIPGSEGTENSDVLQTDSEINADFEDSSPGNMSSLEKSEEIKTEKNNEAENPAGETAEPQSDKSDTDDASKIIKKKSTTIKRARRTPVIAIDERLIAQTDEEKLRDNLIDLVESLKSNVLLSGTVQGVEQSPNNPYSLAVIYHGEFKILIPANEFMEEPDDTHDQPKETVLNYMMTRRMGAEVDYVIKGIDANARIAAASRLEAMRIKRRQYYFATDRDGNNIIHSGINAEARVVSVIRAGIFVDLFGLETYIPLKELSYQRLLDAASQFQTGQRILVKILEVERKNHDVRVLASVKQATENPYEKALRKYSIGNKYVGTVSLVDTNGVFVALDGGIDCLCAYPKRGRPPRGARATVRIIGINYEANRIWGAITHISAPR